MADQEALSPMCVACGKRGEMPSHDTGHAVWSSLPEGWLVGLRGHSLAFACSTKCAQEIDDLNARATKASAPFIEQLRST